MVERVRVIRTVTYEGPEDWLQKQLAQSSPVGTRTLPGDCTIHIEQGTIVKVCDAMDEADMAALLKEADEGGLLLWSRYQDLWFTPCELAMAQAKGRFRWGRVNWTLRPRSERPVKAVTRG